MKDQRLVFGFDVGTNSIGWVVIAEDQKQQPLALIDSISIVICGQVSVSYNLINVTQ